MKGQRFFSHVLFAFLDTEPVDPTKNARTAEVLVPNTCEYDSSQASGTQPATSLLPQTPTSFEFINLGKHLLPRLSSWKQAIFVHVLFFLLLLFFSVGGSEVCLSCKRKIRNTSNKENVSNTETMTELCMISGDGNPQLKESVAETCAFELFNKAQEVRRNMKSTDAECVFEALFGEKLQVSAAACYHSGQTQQ